MSKIRGTKPTRTQRTILVKNKYDPDEYLYVGMVTTQEKENNTKRNKSLDKTSLKKKFMKFVHVTNGNYIECQF